MRVFGVARPLYPNFGPALTVRNWPALPALWSGIAIPRLFLFALAGVLLLPALTPGPGTRRNAWPPTLGPAGDSGATPLFMPTIYLGDDAADPEGCVCLSDGQFAQTVTIEAPVGENWTLSAVSGFLDNDGIPYAVGTVIPETTPGSGVYQLSGRHADGQGFTLTAANGLGDELSIDNTCYYPDVQITDLPAQLCMTSAPVTLTADNGGAAGTGSFTVDGLPATVFNPYLLGAGDHTVEYTFDAGTGTPDDPADPGCVQSVSQVVNVLPGPVIVTNNLVSVALGDDCEAELVADEILEGNVNCEDDFIVTVFDQNGIPIGNTVNSSHVGQTLNVLITTVNGPYNGAGLIQVLDNLDPVVQSCADDTDQVTLANQIQSFSDTLTTSDPTFLMSNFSCYDDASSPAVGPHYYQLDTLVVNLTDYYTLELSADFGIGAAGLYQHAFNPGTGPCQNLIRVSEPVPAGLGFFQGNDVVRIRAQLQAGETYILLTSSREPNATGNFSWAVYSQGSSLVQGLSVSVGDVVQELFCTDTNLLLNNSLSTDFLGLPEVTDNCGNAGFTITFSDALADGGDCGSDVITRTFTIADLAGNDVQCDQTITVPLPTVDDLTLPPKTFLIDCDEPFPTTPGGNPAPSLTGYPFVQSAFGVHTLAPVYCNLSATFTDQPQVQECDGTYNFVRRWFIFDQCNPGTAFNFNQVIRVGDVAAPVVSCPNVDIDFDGIPDPFLYPAGSFDCTAAFQAPLPLVTDNCSGFTILTEVLTDEITPIFNQFGQVIGQDTQQVVIATVLPGAADRFVGGIPVGCHLFRFTVTDDCGNTTVSECEFCVVDNLEPVAVCDDQLIVSVGGNGLGRLFAEDVDEGSSDNCGIEKLEVRRRIVVDPQTCDTLAVPYLTPWAPSVEVYCCDVGTEVEVHLRVTDVAGNVNTCVTTATVFDNALPLCQAPQPTSIACNALPPGFNPSDETQLQALFGEPVVTDNCSAVFEELAPAVNLNNCGYGTILRRFRAIDQFGNISGGTCQQLVVVAETHDYQLKFPKDIAVNDCGIPTPDTLQVFSQGCDDFAVNVTDQIFSVSGSACYKIQRTYEVINWCEYDANAPAIEVARDADCDGVGGDEDVWVIVRPTGVTYYDRDGNEANAVPASSTRGITCDGQTNPAGYWISSNTHPNIASVGRWVYTQTIKVYDTTGPEIDFFAPAPFCSNNSEDCDGAVSLSFTVSEGCTPDDVTVAVYLDANNDGDLDAVVTSDVLAGSYPDYTLSGIFPVGDHAFEVRVNDGCGNTTAATIPFQVVDCVVTAPICIVGLATELMPLPPNTDADGDGDIDAGARTVAVTSFIDGDLIPDCQGPVTYSINRSGEMPDRDQQALVVTCDDLGTMLVEIYAWDNAFNPYAVQPDGTVGGPNFDYCETFLLVQDNQFGLCSSGLTAGVAGGIYTEEDQPVENVMVSLNGPTSGQVPTESNGNYLFENLQSDYDYSVAAYLDDDPGNGVTTFDLVLITRHILGITALDSPYKMIAADANQSGSITTQDIIQIRKLILGEIDAFANSPSWRFIDAGHVFSNPLNPWTGMIPEVISVNDLDGMLTGADFIAVKIGDVNGSAQANSLAGVDDRAADGVLTLSLQEQQLSFGERYEVRLAMDADALVEGFQFTLHLHPSYIDLEEIHYGLLGKDNIGLSRLDEGILTVSWHGSAEELAANSEALVSLTLRARRGGRLSEAVSVSSSYTAAEAYGPGGTFLGVELFFPMDQAEGFALFQNQPNPFREETRIGFFLPRSSQVTLRISDVSGRELKQYRQVFEAGYHHFNVRSDELENQSILFYTLEAGNFSATKKMILIR